MSSLGIGFRNSLISYFSLIPSPSMIEHFVGVINDISSIPNPLDQLPGSLK